MSSANNALTILITGANRGIGFHVLQRLATAFPQNAYLLGTRDPASGTTALSSLESLGVPTDNIRVLPLDVISPASISAAADTLRDDYAGRLDVLVNNAGAAFLPPSDPADLAGLHASFQATFSVNVAAPFVVFQAFLPFLVKSDAPRVINTSSGRGSLTRATTGQLPATAVVAYSASKAAVNSVGVEMGKILEREVGERGRVWAVCPGHCRTAFNGYRGKREPFDGAGVFEVLLKRDEEGKGVESGFWEEEGGVLSLVPW